MVNWRSRFEVAQIIQARNASEWIFKRLQANERMLVESYFQSCSLELRACICGKNLISTTLKLTRRSSVLRNSL